MVRFIILLMTFIVSISVLAHDGDRENILIRQDRIWLCTSWERGEHTAKYMKFTDSKDFMDKTYTRVSTIKKVIWDYGMTNIRIDEDIDKTEAWMREEDGMVYLLLNGWDPYPYADTASSIDLYEGLLYDFNAEDGSSYEGIAQYRPYEDFPGWYCEGWYHLTAVNKDTVGDEEVKHQDVKFSLTKEGEQSTQTYRIVEGIGIVDYGCLYYIETFDHTSGMNFYNSFDCCMDLKGNILYPKDFKDELPGGGPPLGVEGITTEQSEAAAPCHDILGRRIANPAPGQLYIQGGRKLIAK